MGCSFVTWAGRGDGHCRPDEVFELRAAEVDNGRSNEEQRIGNGGRHKTLAGDDFCASDMISGLWKVYTVRAGR